MVVKVQSYRIPLFIYMLFYSFFPHKYGGRNPYATLPYVLCRGREGRKICIYRRERETEREIEGERLYMFEPVAL